MTLMTRLSSAFAIAAVGLTLASGAAMAATANNVGTYDVSDVTTTNNQHVLWLPGLISGSNYYEVVDGSGGLVVTDTTATLSITARQAGSTANDFQVSVTMDLREEGVGSGGPKCAQFPSGTCDAAFIADWDFFEFLTENAVLTGLNDLAGLVLDMTMKPLQNGEPTMPPQLGMGANDKDAGMGMSFWFTYAVSQNTNQISLGTNRYGDVNLSLAAVPLPAGVWLLLAGVGAFGAVRGRKTA